MQVPEMDFVQGLPDGRLERRGRPALGTQLSGEGRQGVGEESVGPGLSRPADHQVGGDGEPDQRYRQKDGVPEGQANPERSGPGHFA
jgi:hypothetical protein